MKIELHSAEEVAVTLGVELDTLYRYARKGRIHGMKVGKAWRFLDADIREFLQQQRYSVKPTAIKTRRLADILRRRTAESGPQGGIACHGVEASYAEVDAAADLLAGSLQGNGVAPGGRVVIVLPNCLEFVVGCFAVWKAGAIPVPEDPLIRDEDLRQVLEECAPQALIVDRSVAERLSGQRAGLENVGVVYIKNRTCSMSCLGNARVESLDAVLEGKAEPKVFRFNNPIPAKLAAIDFAGVMTGQPAGVTSTQSL
jgi:excisionase family DNA binding protein